LQQRLTGRLGFKLLVQLEVGGGGGNGGGKCTHNHDALSRRLHSATDSAVFGENVKFSLSTH
jgi:hypothetical protein